MCPCVCLFMCRCPIVAKYCTNSLVGPRRGPEKLTVEQWEAMIRVHESTHKCGLAIHRDQSCVEPNNGSSHADRRPEDRQLAESPTHPEPGRACATRLNCDDSRIICMLRERVPFRVPEPVPRPIHRAQAALPPGAYEARFR